MCAQDDTDALISVTEGSVPSQKQLQWSQLKVGITVVVAALTLAVLILLMSGASDLFRRKLILRTYFSDANGLLEGAPVRLQGVTVGKVSKIRVVADPSRKLAPIEVTMELGYRFRANLRTDSVTTLATEGILGETCIDIDSSQSKGMEAQNGNVLPTRETPQLEDVIRASQGTFENLDAVVKRLDRLVARVEGGPGTIASLINDRALYNHVNTTASELQGLVDKLASGEGSLGKFLVSDQLYRNTNDVVSKLNAIVDGLQAGNGTAGKFLRDPSLYNNADVAVANIRELTDSVNAGKGALGELARDQEFAEKLKNTMIQFSALMDTIHSGRGTLGKLIQDPSLYNHADELMRETRELVMAVRQNPKKYLTIRLKLF
jgi:phospholipid/cholesterol/gamma-HCH transport system substrate-binding protein